MHFYENWFVALSGSEKHKNALEIRIGVLSFDAKGYCKIIVNIFKILDLMLFKSLLRTFPITG